MGSSQTIHFLGIPNSWRPPLGKPGCFVWLLMVIFPGKPVIFCFLMFWCVLHIYTQGSTPWTMHALDEHPAWTVSDIDHYVILYLYLVSARISSPWKFMPRLARLRSSRVPAMYATLPTSVGLVTWHHPIIPSSSHCWGMNMMNNDKSNINQKVKDKHLL